MNMKLLTNSCCRTVYLLIKGVLKLSLICQCANALVSTLLVSVYMIERERFEALTHLYNIQVNAALGVETVEKLTDRILELKGKIEQMSEPITELIRS